MKIPSEDLDKWTLEIASSIPVIGDTNNIALLRAFCRQESAYGQLATPRHENIWCPNVNRVSAVAITRHHDYGCLACCSYGPLQVLFHSVADYSIVTDPITLLNQRYAFDKAVTLLIRKITRQKPSNISGIADLWNSGNANDAFIPKDYIERFTNYYKEEVLRLG